MTEDAYEMEEERVPRASKPYLRRIKHAQKAFQTYQDKCANIEKKYADLSNMSGTTGDREFKIFWANLEVLKPTIYTRPPQPVVMPRHKDGKDLHRKAAELLERVLIVDVEQDDLHDTLIHVRDDLALCGRGVPWVLDNGSCIHVDRQDFVHEPARKWREVSWVARRAYLTREEVEERFPEADPRKMTFSEKRDGDDEDDCEAKAAIWEFWDRSEGMVCWVSEGFDATLDEAEPLINVKGFFPCPKPAYGTLEPGSLKPVPDFVYYRDQADEINELTARISALAESLRMKGFYASGASDVGEAIESAMANTSNKSILIPVASMAAIGGQGIKDAILWLPVREVAETITSLVALRQQLIQDVYEITGLSDIMRGSSEAQETATAQNLKAQYGSVRVRERQSEMVRIARDVLRLKGEIFAETVPGAELAEMAQMDLMDATSAQQMMAQAQASGQPFDQSKVVTLEDVDGLLKEQRVRPFVLEVESDSTIAPNEQAEKEARTEFVTAIGGFLQQAGPMVQAMPQTGPFVAEMFKFAAGAFRGSRELGPAIDDLAEQVKAAGQQPQEQGPSPEAIKAQADAQKVQMEMQADQQRLQADLQKMQLESQAKMAEAAAKQRQAAADLQKTNAEIEKIRAEIARIQVQAAQQPQEAA